MEPTKRLTLCAVPRIPLIEPGDNLGSLLVSAIRQSDLPLEDGDIVVVAQKVVSKSEDRYVDLASIVPSHRAKRLGALTGKDPRLVEVILSESRRVVRYAPNVLIVEHHLGYVMANAGVDRSNVSPGTCGERVLLIPAEPDRSAQELRDNFVQQFGKQIGVIINDSFGRPWRRGTVGIALGAAGLDSLRDLRGSLDLYDRKLEVSETAFADEVAATASLVMGQANEGLPVVLVSGLCVSGPSIAARELVRPEKEDLFR